MNHPAAPHQPSLIVIMPLGDLASHWSNAWLFPALEQVAVTMATQRLAPGLQCFKVQGPHQHHLSPTGLTWDQCCSFSCLALSESSSCKVTSSKLRAPHLVPNQPPFLGVSHWCYHGCRWETFCIFAHCGLVGNPRLTAKI